MRGLVLALLGLAACGAPAEKKPAASARVAVTCPPPVASSSAPPVSIAPDPPTADDLARAKVLLAASPPLVEASPRFSPDGKRIAYLSTEGGARALYVKELGPKEPARKVSGALPQRFRRPVVSRDGAWLYFTSDEHTDEAFSIFRLSLATGAIEPVTPGEKLRRDGPFLPMSGDRLFFTARKMREQGVVLYSQATTPGAAPTQIYANDQVEFGALRPDGAQLLLLDIGETGKLSVLDLPAHAPPRHLYPEAGKEITIFDVAYSPDGSRVYVATDEGADKSQIVALDARTGRVLLRYVESRFAASRVQELSAKGDRVSFVVDAGVRHDLRILDAATLKPVLLPSELPVGSEVPGAMHPSSTGGLTLSEDGRHVAIQWSTPSSPPRVQVVDTRTGARAPLVDSSSSATAPIETSVVMIPSWDGLALPTLVYLPPNAKHLPVVVAIHGGFPFASTARYDAQVALLVAEGYAVVEPNLRGSGGFGRAYELADDGAKKLDAVRDLGAVGRWVAAQPWADEKRLALTGRSVGGYYTIFGLEHDPDLWRVGIEVVGIFDVESTIRTTDGDLRVFWEKKELGPLSDPLLLAAISPSTYVSRIRSPLFVYGAARDARAPIAQTEALVRALREQDKHVVYMRSDEGHSLDDPKTRADLMARMLGFLKTGLAP